MWSYKKFYILQGASERTDPLSRVKHYALNIRLFWSTLYKQSLLKSYSKDLQRRILEIRLQKSTFSIL